MPRPRKIIPTQGWKVRLPDDLAARVLADLYSSVEQRVPYGAWSGFIEKCVRDHYRRIDERTEPC